MTKADIVRKLGQSTNLFVMAPMTLLAPRWYFRALFDIVKQQQLQWGTKKRV